MLAHQITTDANLDYLVKRVSAMFLSFKNDTFPFVSFISILWESIALLCKLPLVRFGIHGY